MLRLTISLLFALVLEYSAAVSFERFAALEIHSIHDRLKRQSDDGGRCLFMCIDEMREGMSTLGLSQSSQSSFMQMPVLTNQTIRQYCNVYRQGKQCISDCPVSQHTDAVQIGFAGSDYMCVQKLDEFIGFLSCYKRAEGTIKSYCDKGCEGGDSQLAQLHSNTVRAKTDLNLENSMASMNQACRLIGCQLSCQAPVIVEYCNNDPNAASLLEQFAARSWKAMRRIHIRQQGLASNPTAFPQYCNAVADSDFQQLAPVQHSIPTVDYQPVPENDISVLGLENSDNIRPEILEVNNVDNSWYNDRSKLSNGVGRICYIFNFIFTWSCVITVFAFNSIYDDSNY